MNRKLLVAAVSAAVVAPAVGYADATWYASVRNALDLNDIPALNNDGVAFANHESQTDISGVAGRLGVRASSDIGNGMTAHGRYEFSTTTDKEGGGIEDTRIATVGLSGAFGRVDVGNQWSSYYDTFGTLVSPTFSLGAYLYSGVGGGVFRSSNTIKYSNTFGQLYAELDIRLNDDSSPEGSDVAEELRGDGFGLGLSFAVNDNLTIAAAFDSEDGLDDDARVTRGLVVDDAAVITPGGLTDSDADRAVTVTTPAIVKYEADDGRSPAADRVGIGVKGTFGGYWASLGWQSYETDDLGAVTLAAKDEDTAGTADAGDEPAVTAPAKDGKDIDTIFLYGGGNFSEKTNWLLAYSTADRNTTGVDDATQITWGVYHNLGGGLRLFYEATDLDDESTNRDGIRHLMGMRVDF